MIVFGTQRRRARLIPPVSPPTTPGSFTATPVGSPEINLTWTDSTGETSYVLDYSGDDVSFFALATPSAGSTSYSHGGLTNGTQVYYRIRAVNSGGNSAYAYANATTDP